MGNKVQWGDSGAMLLFGLDANGSPEPLKSANGLLISGPNPNGDYPANIFAPISTVTIAAASLTVTGLHGIHSGQFKLSGLTTETISLTGLSDAGTNMGQIKLEYIGKTAADVDVNAAVIADVDAAVAAAKSLVLLGYSCRESAAAPAAAEFRIMHGATAAGGTPAVEQILAANEANTEWFGPDGISCPNGISIDWIAGELSIDIYYATLVGVPNSALLGNGDYRIVPPLTVAGLTFTKSAAAETVTISGMLSGAS